MLLRLKTLRESRNIKQVEIAKSIGRPNASYSRWEIGQRQMDYDTLIAVADFFDVSIDYLLGRTENKRFLASMDENENGFECSAEEKDLVRLYRQAPDKYKGRAYGILEACSMPTSSVNKKAVVFPATAGISRKNIKNIQKKEG